MDKTSNRLAFTKRRLEALPIPLDGRMEYLDVKTPGLRLRVTPSNRRTFCLFRKVRGQPIRLTIGTFPEMTVEQARRAVSEAVREIRDGKDPRAQKRKDRNEATFRDLFTHWIEMHAKVHKRTWQEDERQYNVFLKQWAGRKLSSITKQDIQELHARVGRDNGRYAANRLLALVRAAFNKAADIGWTGANPTAGIKKFKEQSRDRFLQVDELPRFFGALQHESDLFRDFFLICLLTGARRSNVQSMAWTDIDFHSAVWRIPETKSGHPVLVPLVRPAIGVLRARREASDDSPWVFSTRSRIGHLTEPKTAWRRVCNRAEIDGLTIHDLRRSMGSYLAITGASLPVIGKMLGHTQPSTTAVYSRLTLDPVRASVDKAVDAMVAAGGDNGILFLEAESNGQDEA